MDATVRFLMHRLYEELIWLRQLDLTMTLDDAMAYLRDQCGFVGPDCRYARSEYCVLDCPFRPAEGVPPCDA